MMIHKIEYEKLVAIGLKPVASEYYAYALGLVSNDPTCIKHIIKRIYLPVSVEFGETISTVERIMREALESDELIKRIDLKIPLTVSAFLEYLLQKMDSAT